MKLSHNHAVSPPSFKLYIGQLILRGNLELKWEKEQKERKSEESQHFTNMISSWAAVGPVNTANLKNY